MLISPSSCLFSSLKKKNSLRSALCSSNKQWLPCDKNCILVLNLKAFLITLLEYIYIFKCSNKKGWMLRYFEIKKRTSPSHLGAVITSLHSLNNATIATLFLSPHLKSCHFYLNIRASDLPIRPTENKFTPLITVFPYGLLVFRDSRAFNGLFIILVIVQRTQTHLVSFLNLWQLNFR